MLNLIKRLALALAVASLVGCAAKVTQTSTSPSKPGTTSIATQKVQAPAGALVAVVTGSPSVLSNGDWQDFLKQWQASLANSARTAKLPFHFAKDEAAIPANASILVRLTVNDFRYVSTGKRFALGVMAGNASMDVDAQYIELPANKPFGSKKFNTTSSAWEGIFSAVTPKQVQTVSELIVNEAVSTAPAK